VNNYRGISLISCAFKVLLSLMASCLSKASEEADLISKAQSGFWKREEAVAQATALAEIVQRRWIKGKTTYGVFVDFKKAYCYDPGPYHQFSAIYFALSVTCSPLIPSRAARTATKSPNKLPDGSPDHSAVRYHMLSFRSPQHSAVSPFIPFWIASS